MVENFEAYRALGSAIVQQAAEDYFMIYAGFSVENFDRSKSQLEEFFTSDYFSTLTNLDGKALLKAVEKHAKEMDLNVDVAKGADGKWYCFFVKTGERVDKKTYTKKTGACKHAADIQGIELKHYNMIRRRDRRED